MTAPNPTPGGALPVARYRFSVRVVDPVQLPHYAGSLLRGQFGAALRHLACMTHQPSCTGCPLRETCPYTRVFEAPAPKQHALQRFSAIPNAYVMEPPPPILDKAQQDSDRWLQPGQELAFHMVLIGYALEQLPLIIIAWQRALARGLTKTRSRLTLEQVQWEAADGLLHPIWTATQPHIQPHAARLDIPSPPDDAQALRLHFHTPLRLQQQGHALPADKLAPRTLISHLTRRLALVMEFHAGQARWGSQVPAVVALAEQVADRRQMRWFDWTRYSSRQQREMALGGVVGQWQLHANTKTLTQLWPWLWLGQWLHVGKNATMGLGGYRLIAAAPTD